MLYETPRRSIHSAERSNNNRKDVLHQTPSRCCSLVPHLLNCRQHLWSFQWFKQAPCSLLAVFLSWGNNGANQSSADGIRNTDTIFLRLSQKATEKVTGSTDRPCQHLPVLPACWFFLGMWNTWCPGHSILFYLLYLYGCKSKICYWMQSPEKPPMDLYKTCFTPTYY